MHRPHRPYDSTGGPELIGAIVDFIERYRDAGEPAQRLQETVLGVFPNASGGDFAVALVRANRRRDGR